jgi:serine phosphatase RsbU (regulator of sigma subunit)
MSWLEAINNAPASARYHHEAVNQIVQCVQDGVYCAVLGPRLSGKTVMLRFVERSLARTLGWTCVYIDLSEVQASTMQGFFAELARLTAGRLNELAGPLSLPGDDELASSAAFRAFLSDCVLQLRRDLVLIIEHLEDIPTDLAQALLTSLRAAYMDQQTQDYRVTVVLSGALSLATLTLGESSPFRGIARRVFIGDLTESDSRALIEEYLAEGQVDATQVAMRRLMQAASGDHFLIRKLSQRCVELVHASEMARLGARSVDRVLRRFLRHEVFQYAPLLDAVRLIEEDPDLLQSILALLERDVVPKTELPLPLSPDLDPLYLTGVVERVDGSSYRVQNLIYRRFLEDYFDPEYVGHMFVMAGRWDSALDYLEASACQDKEGARSDLLPATINSMHASSDLPQAARFLLRGLAAAFGVAQAQVWYAPHQEHSLRLIGEVGAFAVGELRRGTEIPLSADRLETRAFRQAVPLRGAENEGFVRRAIPLAIPGRDPIGVVTVWDELAPGRIREQRERELQVQGYLHQATRALQAVSTRRQELALAGRMQASLLPRSLPEVPGYQFAAAWRPVLETSGDYYDFIELPGGRLGIVIADVVDKGIGAALYMALSRTLVRTYAQDYPDEPHAVLRTVNERILQDADGGHFVTLFYAVLEPVSGRLTYCNAGHNPPYLLLSGWNLAPQALRRTGMALGVTDEMGWTQARVQLPAGGMLLLYTDGLVDAQDDAGQPLGVERLLELATPHLSGQAAEIQEAILAGVRKFTGDAAQVDDMTLVVLKREKKP